MMRILRTNHIWDKILFSFAIVFYYLVFLIEYMFHSVKDKYINIYIEVY